MLPIFPALFHPAPTLVSLCSAYQCHLSGTPLQHDFNSDPIRLVRDGDWLKADGTTLGADNGIGVAAALALLELPPTGAALDNTINYIAAPAPALLSADCSSQLLPWHVQPNCPRLRHCSQWMRRLA